MTPPKPAGNQTVPPMQTALPVPSAPGKGAPVPAPAYVVPGGTSELAWNVAAALADSTVAELLKDTAPVKSAHYMAGLRVTKVFSDWLLREDAAAEAHAVASDARWWAGEKPGLPDQTEPDPFARLMVLAEDAAKLTASARDGGDAVAAAKYSSFESELLQVAAALQIRNDIEMGK